MSKELIILHEYGEKRHFRALEYLLETKYPKVRLYYREYSISGHFKKILKEKSLRALGRMPLNLFTLVLLHFKKDRLIILGMAPFDIRILDLSQILKSHKVFYFTSWVNWNGSHFPKPRFTGIKVVSDTWKLFLEKELSGIFAVTQSTLDGLRQRYRITCPVSVVNQSFAEEIFYPAENMAQQANVRSSLRCLFVGRLVEEKGVDDILVLAERLPEEKFDFQFVGDGPLKSHILEKSRQHDNVKWHGFITSPLKLADIYRNSDVLLLPGRKSPRWEETFGMVIIEAMACGVVVLASGLSGPRQILQDNNTGFLVRETEFVEDAYIILQDLYENHSELLHRKKKSIQLAQNYTAGRLSEKWEDLLRDYLQ